MNIKEAKDEIKNAMIACFTKDEYGNYVIPIEKQRPIFLMGPPGIGKTAIMEQVAQELGVGFISYSMTHHTRQSALGLPYIEKKMYGGEEYSVSEYTMSEIIASVYDRMEETGLREGILFLDEINCVSETLAPSMLQFLQYKIFGRHRVPDGWIIVTAGNPPEYNNSVREFDIATWDRLKRMDVEPDYESWKEYALNHSIHPAIITYLDTKQEYFYTLGMNTDRFAFVTARGWSDLSEMIRIYEMKGMDVKESLISQYLQDEMVAKDFAIYYDLFNRYKSDYRIDAILSGEAPDSVKERAEKAGFDERLALLGLLLDGMNKDLSNVYLTEHSLTELLKDLKEVQKSLADEKESDVEALLKKQLLEEQKRVEQGKKSTLSAEKLLITQRTVKMLEEQLSALKRVQHGNAQADFAFVKKYFNKQKDGLKKKVLETGKELSNLFRFCEEVFEEGQEILILVTELTIGHYASHYIARYGCKEYFAHSDTLMFHERKKKIIADLKGLNLEEDDDEQ